MIIFILANFTNSIALPTIIMNCQKLPCPLVKNKLATFIMTHIPLNNFDKIELKVLANNQKYNENVCCKNCEKKCKKVKGKYTLYSKSQVVPIYIPKYVIFIIF